MRDFLHPEVLPGSYIWADLLLYECVPFRSLSLGPTGCALTLDRHGHRIKRAYYRVGRSDLS
jgi:hypothetical protein